MNRAINPFSLKLAIALSILFACCIALIRAQPYDDGEQRTLLTSLDSCPASCFMGIRPGVTMINETLELLRTSDWVRYIRYMDRALEALTYTGSLRWEWSGRQPAWIDTERDSSIWLEENQVDQITIPTRYRLGEIWLAYGAPDYGRLFILSDVDFWMIYRGVYLQYGFFAETGGACPVRNYWDAPVLLTFRSGLLSYLPDTSGDESSVPQDMIRCLRWLSG